MWVQWVQPGRGKAVSEERCHRCAHRPLSPSPQLCVQGMFLCRGCWERMEIPRLRVPALWRSLWQDGSFKSWEGMLSRPHPHSNMPVLVNFPPGYFSVVQPWPLPGRSNGVEPTNRTVLLDVCCVCATQGEALVSGLQ